jgi:hypothetical protein
VRRTGISAASQASWLSPFQSTHVRVVCLPRHAPTSSLPSPQRCVQPTNLLPTRVVITSNNHHRRLLPTERFGPPTRSILGYERSLRSYPINPCGVGSRKGGAFVLLHPSGDSLGRLIGKPFNPQPLISHLTNSNRCGNL